MVERALRDGQATRNAILDAAEAVFSRHGYGESPLGEVAAQAGITKSLIHHYFASKQDLWREVLDRRFAEYSAKQSEILASPEFDLAKLERSVRMMFGFLQENPALVRLHSWANAGGAVFTSEMGGALTARGIELLRKGQAAGVVRGDVDPASVLAAFFSLVEHWFQAREALVQLFGDAHPSDATYLDTIVRILIDGIRAPERHDP